MPESCALIGQGGSAFFFFHFLPCLCASDTSAACGTSPNVKGVSEKWSVHLSSGTSSKI